MGYDDLDYGMMFDYGIVCWIGIFFDFCWCFRSYEDMIGEEVLLD